jgi:hypothetical protein
MLVSGSVRAKIAEVFWTLKVNLNQNSTVFSYELFTWVGVWNIKDEEFDLRRRLRCSSSHVIPSNLTGA